MDGFVSHHVVFVGSIGRPQLTFPTPPTRATGQRPRKKLRLPEVQQLVRSLAVENENLRESAQENFVLPDLNLLPQDTADVPSVH
nr:unnamed protein product [Digitaria exilis]